ncbi:hypothetical protein [Janibacter massiliensis]|uniref:hypothetical protein n=1 Tax=Janibacter massiliensis TaxID=2058291 RepID=UPI000D0E7531|nr:hypothetical protein [Janibacter massiliensis]
MSDVTLPTIDMIGDATELADWLTSHGLDDVRTTRHGAGMDADGKPFLASVGLSAIGVPSTAVWCVTATDPVETLTLADGVADEVLAWPVFMVRGE